MGSTQIHSAASESWQAGDLVLDVGLQRVMQSGKPVDLPRLSFELLLVLLRGAPHFISNEELMARVWRGLVVSPETVTQRVKLLRDALGDDPRQPRYIEGLRGRGYRLIPDALRLDQEPVAAPHADDSAANAASLEPASGSRPGTHVRPRRWVAGLVALGALAAAAAFALLRAPAPQVPVTAADRTAAILPFELAGNVPAGREVATGLVDSVLSQLSNIQGLQVVAGNSSFQLDATQLGPAATGEKLGARYLVQGSMQQNAQRMRVIAKLVDAHSGSVLWTQQFDRDVGDFFGLQDAVATGIAGALERRIAGLDTAVPTAERSRDVQAQLAYLRGRALLGRTTVAGSRAAAKEFELALQRDPQFVPATVGLYDARMQVASLLRTGMNEARNANEVLLARAVALQPDSGAAQLARAMWGADDRATRVELFEEGLKQDAANVRAMTAYSELLDSMGRRDEAARWLNLALRIDPLWSRARFRAAQRNFPNVGSAIEQQTQKLLELDPNYYPALQRQAKYRWQMHGEITNAISIIERAIAADPENPWAPHTAVAFYLDVDEPQAAESLSRQNAVVEASTAAVRALYAGDTRRAGEAALAAGSFEFGAAERWGVTLALRDHALRGGPRSRIMALLADRYGLPADGRWNLSASNFREALLLAHLLLTTGRRDAGSTRVDEVIAWIDANGFMGPVYNLRTKAQALALKGESDAALVLLAESFEKLDYTQWWYTLDRDPVWASLRSDPRFVAMAGKVRAHIATERSNLQQLRDAGQIPRR
jgi:TolB-like protein/DNA-binding winged helix-turn-helix (wHTH) protein